MATLDSISDMKQRFELLSLIVAMTEEGSHGADMWE